MRRTTYDRLERLYQRSEGYISTRELLEGGFTNRQIAFLTEEHYLEKVCHGHYWMPQGGYEKPFDYKCIEVCLADPRAVIAMESACYYQGILETEPKCMAVATERTDRSAVKLNFPVERHYFSGDNFKLGIKRVQRKMGSYNIYDPERSICDIVRLRGEKAGRDILAEILDGVKAEKEQYERILEYAKLLRVKNLREI